MSCHATKDDVRKLKWARSFVLCDGSGREMTSVCDASASGFRRCGGSWTLSPTGWIQYIHRYIHTSAVVIFHVSTDMQQSKQPKSTEQALSLASIHLGSLKSRISWLSHHQSPRSSNRVAERTKGIQVVSVPDMKYIHTVPFRTTAMAPVRSGAAGRRPVFSGSQGIASSRVSTICA